MTFNEAREILGLEPGQDVRPHLGKFRMARERIAKMVREAPNDRIAVRYQEELVAFDRALAACREYLGTTGLEVPETPAAVVPKPLFVPPVPVACEKAEAPVTSRAVMAAAWLLVIVAVLTVGGYFYLEREREEQRRLAGEIARLESRGASLIDARRWRDAMDIFERIDALSPDSGAAAAGRAAIELGMIEEERQFIGYWTGQAIAEIEAGRLDEAEAAVRTVLEKHPAASEAIDLMNQVTDARERMSRQLVLDEIREMLDARKWQDASQAAAGILRVEPGNLKAEELLAHANSAMEKQAADEKRADDLFRMAAARDLGQFDDQALEILREAAGLAPENEGIAALLEKMSSYTRTLRIPGDFDTPAAALATARDRDRIVIAAGTWKGPLVVNAAVDIEGAGPGQTVIDCPPAIGSPMVVGPGALGARISGISFMHDGFLVDGSERYAAVMVRGGDATFVDCHFSAASGHGLAVIDGGEVLATRCRFVENGWNGATAIGAGSKLELRESEASENFGHGIESWGGASLILVNNRCHGNARNGIHTDNLNASAVIDGNRLSENREYALVLTSAGNGKITNNSSRGNLLGGFVIRRAAATLAIHGNEARDNHGPGLILEQGLAAPAYADNRLSGNKAQEILADVELPEIERAPPDTGGADGDGG
jgi:tetratricopeptide (TPR) repeat protein